MPTLGLLPLRAAKTGNLEIETIKLGNFYIRELCCCISDGLLAKLEGPRVSFIPYLNLIISITALFCSINDFTTAAISSSGIMITKLYKQVLIFRCPLDLKKSRTDKKETVKRLFLLFFKLL